MEDNLVPLFGIVFVFGIPIVAIVGLAMYFIKRDGSRNRLREKIVTCGLTDKDVVHELLRNQDGAKKGQSYITLRIGMMLMFAGVGAIAAHQIYGDCNYLMFSALVAMFAGVGLLGSFFIELQQSKHKPESQNDETAIEEKAE